MRRCSSISIVAATLLSLSGCGRDSGAPQPITTDKIVAGAPDVFKGAPADVQTLAAAVVEAINKQEFTSAWEKLQELNTRPGLTDAQREFVAQSVASVGAEVNKAGESGNEAAQKALEFYRANK